ncbi:DUF6952 family protein [Solitalea lacus]|uniref:DUF6952 family protein n=1 Tax=Solitalea lacus TaxID=2911172 RepID=UPI001EDC88EA|nr:hypothetical protein [Solitalea lacus]UKJ08615.1 hypothetical protein L2B55_05470 [Solitalea lacus]
MKIPAIKKLVEAYDLATLQLTEEALMEEQIPSIEVEGDDEGEQLTHILAAIWIKQEMEKTGDAFPQALRAYTSRVRTSIS